jgi:hypothetical protein
MIIKVLSNQSPHYSFIHWIISNTTIMSSSTTATTVSTTTEVKVVAAPAAITLAGKVAIVTGASR